jgi:hypothetical protein
VEATPSRPRVTDGRFAPLRRLSSLELAGDRAAVKGEPSPTNSARSDRDRTILRGDPASSALERSVALGARSGAAEPRSATFGRRSCPAVPLPEPASALRGGAEGEAVSSPRATGSGPDSGRNWLGLAGMEFSSASAARSCCGEGRGRVGLGTTIGEARLDVDVGRAGGLKFPELGRRTSPLEACVTATVRGSGLGRAASLGSPVAGREGAADDGPWAADSPRGDPGRGSAKGVYSPRGGARGDRTSGARGAGMSGSGGRGSQLSSDASAKLAPRARVWRKERPVPAGATRAPVSGLTHSLSFKFAATTRIARSNELRLGRG